MAHARSWLPLVFAVTACAHRMPAIHDAAFAGRIGEVRSLLAAHPEQVGATDGYGRTPLHLAAIAGKTDVAELLLAHGASLEARDSSGETALFTAADGYGHEELVAALLAHHASVDARDSRGRTALHEAAIKGQVATVTLLLAHGADPDARADDRSTPLQFAAEGGDDAGNTAEVATVLLDAHAAIDPVDATGKTPLYWAVITRHAAVADVLRKRGAKEDDGIGTAVVEGDLDRVTALIAANPAVVGERDGRGSTPLHLAVEEDRAPFATLLLDAHADLEAEDSYGRTPLHIAAAHGSVAMVELLVGRGARVDAVTTHHARTALIDAAGGLHADVVTALLGHGASIDATDDQGDTALIIVAGSRPVDYDHPGPGSTGDPEAPYQAMVSLLLARGADVTIANHAGKTALTVANEWNHAPIAVMLRRHAR